MKLTAPDAGLRRGHRKALAQMPRDYAQEDVHNGADGLGLGTIPYRVVQQHVDT